MSDKNSLKRSVNGDQIECSEETAKKRFKSSESCQNCNEISNRISKLEEKLDKQASDQSVVLDVMNKKLDKLVRLLSDVHEQESKMSKTFANFNKMLEQTKASPPARSIGAFLQNLQEKSEKVEKAEKADNSSKADPPVEQPVIQRKPPNEIDELRWGANVYLLGDSLFQMLQEIEDVNRQLQKMKEKPIHMKIFSKNGAKVGDLYDNNRDIFKSPMPHKITKVVISLGGQDLEDPSLLTLKEASLGDLKQKNKPLLEKKGRHIKSMIRKLLKMGKQVVYIIPVTCVQRKEVFQQFEEVVLEVLSEFKAEPNFKLLNLPELIRSTVTEFDSKEEHLQTWFSDRVKSTLSDYGCRRLMDSLKRTILSKTVEGQVPCTRCTRNHPGGAEKCKSIDKLCKRCGTVGHFVEVHDVMDVEFRKLIVQTLGVDIYDVAYLSALANGETALGVYPNPDPEKFNDYYTHA